MAWNDVAQIIGSFGFPILACIAMGWYVKYTIDQNNQQMKEMREEQRDILREHKEEMKEVTTALDNNTLVIQKLCDKLGDTHGC